MPFHDDDDDDDEENDDHYHHHILNGRIYSHGSPCKILPI
jgi:hypothetical protein